MGTILGDLFKTLGFGSAGQRNRRTGEPTPHPCLGCQDNETMDTPIQEIDKSNFKRFKNLDIVAFLRAAPGAMGDAGAVEIVTFDRCVYHANPDFGDISMDQVCQVCPPLKDCHFMTFGGGKIPQGWSTVYLGMGNYLVMKDAIFDFFSEAVEQAGFCTPAGLYGAWLDIVLNILSRPNWRKPKDV